jgi:hypothetical protein
MATLRTNVSIGIYPRSGPPGGGPSFTCPGIAALRGSLAAESAIAIPSLNDDLLQNWLWHEGGAPRHDG